MAITTQMRTDVSGLYVALFGRAPDSEGLGYWVQQLDQGKTLEQVADAMYGTAPARTYYPAYLTNQEIIGNFYVNVLGRPADPEGSAYWTGKLNEPGATPGSVIAELVSVVANYTGTDPAGLQSAALFNNKVMVAQWYGEHIGAIVGSDAVLALVTADPASVAAAEAAATGPSTSATYLTVGQDTLTGTAGADTFVANVVQNGNGEQTNQLGTGDSINGGAGIDTLNAKVQVASPLGSYFPTSDIAPETKSVEVANFTALNTQGTNGYYYYGVNDSGINAKDMLGLNKVASVNSDASLVVNNLTTLTDTGNYADRRTTDSITVRMDHSAPHNTGGADSSAYNGSNMVVLFDNDYLIAQPPTTSTKTFWWLLDQKSDLAHGQPLAHIDSDGLSFTINGVVTSIAIPKEVFDALDGSYSAFVSALNAQIAATPALAGYSVTLDPTNSKTVALADGSASSSIPAIVLNAPEGIDVTSTGFHHYADATGSYDVYGNIADAPLVTTEKLVTSNIELFKVGRGAEGGHLVVGAQNSYQYNGEYNGGDSTYWDRSNYLDYSHSALKEGVEQFNVTVFGDNTQFSDLSSLQSTNNTLRVVNVSTDAAQAGKYADLLIHDLKDVQTFDASSFKGNLTLAARLTNEVTAKYLDLTDQAPAAAAADNVAFQYKGGLGNDKISLELDPSNLEAAGTATREDFSLNIDGGAGNDTLKLHIADQAYILTGSSGQPSFQNWYDNQALNANLSINGGEGDDTISKPGSGNVVIDAGTGNDTVYADNIGANAVWAFNVENSVPGAYSARYQLNNLQSDANDPYNLFKAKLTVSFDGFEKQVDIADNKGLVSDLAINQAIKLAINSDAVLSKLVAATDGPGNTLVVTSLVDGSSVASDLSVSIQAPTTLTAAEALQVNGYYGTSVDATTLLANFASQVTAFNTAADYASTFAANGAGAFSGSDSAATSDNLITGGLGNDVLVLGTGAYSNDGVKYVGYGNGTDSIVHFETGAAGFVYNGGTAEVVTLTFADSDGTPAAETIVFDGVTVTLSSATTGVIPALDVAHQFVTQYNAASATNHWTAAEGSTPGAVILTNDANGNVTDLTAADFTGSYFGTANGNGSVGTPGITDGTDVTVPATFSTFTVTYNDATTAAAAGTTIGTATIVAGDGSLTIAGKVAAAFAGYTAGSVVHTATGDSVTFTADAAGAATALPTAADLKVGSGVGDLADGILGTFTGTQGTDATTTAPELVSTATGIDYLDFTAYKATAVIVNGAAIVGSLPTTGVYISLVESTTNAGEYTISEYNLGTTTATTDDTVKVIGVADFGQHEVFNAANFHI